MYRARYFSLTLAVALASCGGGTATDAGSPPDIVGRVERGSTIQVMMRDASGASVIPTAGVSISPATAGTVSGNSIQLTQAGSATISASANGRVGTVAITIAVPPTIYF